MFDFLAEAGVKRDTSNFYILGKSGEPERCDSAADWARFMERLQPIEVTEVGRFQIATVFTGEDLRKPGDEGDPILWLTASDPPLNEAARTYRSREDAITGHSISVKAAAEAQNVKPISRQMCEPEGEPRKAYSK